MTEDAAPWESEERLRDFAREFVRTGNAVTAAQSARVLNIQYSARVWTDRLLRRPDVQEWIAEARAEGVDKPRPTTRETIADDLQEVFELSLAAGSFAASVSAKKTQAEVLGLLEKNVRVTFGRDVKELSMDEIERELARLRSEGVVELLPAGVAEDGVQVYGGG